MFKVILSFGLKMRVHIFVLFPFEKPYILEIIVIVL